MKELYDIKETQIRVIGETDNKKPRKRFWWIVISVVLLMLLGFVIVLLGVMSAPPKEEKVTNTRMAEDSEPGYFEPVVDTPVVNAGMLGSKEGAHTSGYTEVRDTLINDIPLKIFIPHNAEMSLHIGAVNTRDTSIIYVAQAADIRRDNGGIVGAFVLDGRPVSWGLSKKGYCASIDGKVTIGVADNSPLFEEATERGGYFFRQYPLVSNGRLVENKPKGKSIRRGICERMGEIFMVESGTPESFHDFSQALVDLGVTQAVYLVGSDAYGWAVDKAGKRIEFGEDYYYSGPYTIPENISYIVWRKK